MIKEATENEINSLFDYCTTGNITPSKVRELVNMYRFSKSTMQSAIDLVLNSHDDRSSYFDAMECKSILTYAILMSNES